MPPHAEQARWFAEKVQPHESSLRSYLRNVFPSLPDVDDLVQESYARLIRAKETGRVSYVKAFLFTTARNAALDIFRRRQVVAIDGVADLRALPVIEDRPDAAEAVNQQQELAMLSEAVRGLPNRCRQVLTLRLLYGMSQKRPHARRGGQLRAGARVIAPGLSHEKENTPRILRRLARAARQSGPGGRTFRGDRHVARRRRQCLDQ